MFYQEQMLPYKEKNKKIEKLNLAKKRKFDEFYTLYEDIENELSYYFGLLNGKTVLCSCDDAEVSNFFKYFVDNFKQHGLKSVIASCYKPGGNAYWVEYDGVNYNKEYHKGSGDFRSSEVLKLTERADVIITNPPFSLFGEMVKLYVKMKKDFLLLGPLYAATYKHIFDEIKNNRIRLGITKRKGATWFLINKEYLNAKYYKIIDDKCYVSMSSAVWFTTLEHGYEPPMLELTKEYNPEKYPMYSNYNAIEVSSYMDIPYDYDGLMGVPVSFLSKYNSQQFEIVSYVRTPEFKDGTTIFKRLIIKHKNKSA